MPFVEYTKEMNDSGYTLLAPDMLPIHFNMLVNLFKDYGYNLKLLRFSSKECIDEGLKYVHNDTCYPALIVIGQMLHALNSGEYDLNKTALILTQTGGGCRASNYIHLLRKALEKDGLGHIPVVSLNPSGLEKNSGFKLSIMMIYKMLAVVNYGDLMMLLRNQTRPYQINPNACDEVIEKWTKKLDMLFKNKKGYSFKDQRKYSKEIAKDFADIEIIKTNKIKVGLVGEIYVKYSSVGNNDIEEFLFNQGCEINVPGLMGFLEYCLDHTIDDVDRFSGKNSQKITGILGMKILTKYENIIMEAVKSQPKFHAPQSFYNIKKMAENVIDTGCVMGEGWLLTGEMYELIEAGYTNIICMQPFGCLPNHIVGKGMIRKLKSIFPDSNIVPIDYDPGATKVNQENRIKLMLAVARENMEKQENGILTEV
ncbi:2-hydroxyacyl-CoA dehydratase [Eubacteriales bacterium OttesenSCG-928-G02]|nr:2-hydroxyacyl-CoA dehydratase [Eubacteriales bacterium OttesenSCG-928-G02]